MTPNQCWIKHVIANEEWTKAVDETEMIELKIAYLQTWLGIFIIPAKETGFRHV